MRAERKEWLWRQLVYFFELLAMPAPLKETFYPGRLPRRSGRLPGSLPFPSEPKGHQQSKTMGRNNQ
jgi:hypothetical protein